MKVRSGVLAMGLGALLGFVSEGVAATSTASYKDEVKAGLEEIFVFRTTRTRRTTGETPDCAKAPFPSAAEDFYELWSVSTRASDSRIVDTHERNVGGFTACFAQAVAGKPLQMYATGTVGKVAWSGAGECTGVQSQPPVKTVIALNCVLALSNLPEGYSGGFLVSSTVAPNLGRGADPTAHVRGYLSTSVVTVRLWRKPSDEGVESAPASSR